MPVHRLTPTRAGLLVAALLPVSTLAQAAGAADDAYPRFIGPLASPAPPLPKGAGNIEPYLVTTTAPARFDAHGNRLDNQAPAQWDVIVPIQYGLTDRLTLGATLAAAYDRLAAGRREAAAGDTTISALYGLHDSDGPSRFRLAAGIRQRLPSGRHDHLEERRTPGSGSGASSTTLALQSQAYFLDGHLRARAAMSWRVPGSHARVHGASVYETGAGFAGKARLDASWTGTVSAEYSVDPRWTLVAEAMYERDEGTLLRGSNSDGSIVDARAPMSWRLSLLPAVQYHFNDNVGVIAGVQLALAGRNTAAIVAPQVAVNIGF